MILGANISLYEAQGPICLGDYILDMGIPGYITANFKYKVFGMITRLKDLAIDNIWLFNGLSTTENIQNLALSWGKNHFPNSFLKFQVSKGPSAMFHSKFHY